MAPRVRLSKGDPLQLFGGFEAWQKFLRDYVIGQVHQLYRGRGNNFKKDVDEFHRELKNQGRLVYALNEGIRGLIDKANPSGPLVTANLEDLKKLIEFYPGPITIRPPEGQEAFWAKNAAQIHQKYGSLTSGDSIYHILGQPEKDRQRYEDIEHNSTKRESLCHAAGISSDRIVIKQSGVAIELPQTYDAQQSAESSL